MQFPNKKKWLPWLLAAVMAPFAAGVWLVPYFRAESGTAPAAPTVPAPVISSVRPGTPLSPQVPPTSDVGKSTEVRPLPMPKVPVAGNLGTITDLRAQLEEKRIRQALHEIDVKLAGAAQASSSGVAVLTPDALARMVTPEISLTPEPAPGDSTASRPVVVSVQGVDGQLSATLRSNGQLLTLRAGQKFPGGTVTNVSRDRVTIRGARGVESLAFE